MEWKISSVVMQVEFIRLNENGDVTDKLIVPNAQNQNAIGLVGAKVPEELKKFIFEQIKFQDASK